MGCYDTITFHCPDCGEEISTQSKGGKCLLEIYPHTAVPSDVAYDANRHAPIYCKDCGSKWSFVETRPEFICLVLRKEN